MVITKMAIPRRTVLRGLGATLALPLLDSMVPAFASAQSAAAPVKRLGVVYVPNGVVMKNWTPAAEGALELSPTLEPLGPYKDRVLVLSGLNSKPPAGLTGANIGVHARAATRFLTDVPPKHTNNAEIHAGVSMDQMFAKQAGQHTQLASLELALEGRDFAGSCDVGYSCAYSNTIAWSSPTTPLPMEHNPRVVFERLFGDAGTTDARRGSRGSARDRSLLDSVTEKANSLGRRVGAADRVKLNEYPRSDPRHRAPDPARRAAELGIAAGRSAGRHSNRLRRSREADVRPAAARLPERPDAGHHADAGPRDQRTHVPRNRRPRSAPPDVAPQQRSGQAREPGKDQRLSRDAVLVLTWQSLPRLPTATARCSTTWC
jgi:hypothetical protein